jgi:AraC-like DNA-binding protein
MANYFQYKKICVGRDYIAEHYPERFDLADAARHSHMSRYHFIRIFTRTFGETHYAFMIRLRIEKAKQLFVNGDASIGEVCEQVGYQSLGSFSSLFRRQVGISPMTYRRRLWNLSSESFRYPSQAIPSCYAYHLMGKRSR